MINNLSPPCRARDLRRRAREALGGHWLIAVALTLLAALLGAEAYDKIPVAFHFKINLPSSDFFFKHEQAISDALQPLADHVVPLIQRLNAFMNDLTASSPLLPVFLWIAQLFAVCGLIHFLIGGCVRLGLVRFQLALLDGEQPSAGLLFSGFQRLFFKAILIRILRGLFIFLWSLLLVIPGIVAAYRYAMADYALAENPNMSALDALRESKRMMKDNKWRLFCLRLSFIGWHLLSSLTCGIGYLWLNPYIGQADTAFYHQVSGRAAVREAVGALDDVMADL